MDNNHLLLLGGVLRWLFPLVVLELSFVVFSFCLIGGGCHNAMDDPMVNELFFQILGTVEGSWS